MTWIRVERPGYFGEKRDELFSLWTRKYGKNNWRIVWQWGPLVIPRRLAIQLYEDGYYEFLKANHDVLEWLVSTASDVYDTAPSNIVSGFDYRKQETSNEHIQDIVIRRALLRLGRTFVGDHLMEVRRPGSEGYRLTPGVVPFHLPHMIVPKEINDYAGKGIWWLANTIEDFYQRNKILQIRESGLPEL